MDSICTFISNHWILSGALLFCFAPIGIAPLYFMVIYLHKVLKLPFWIVWLFLYVFILAPWAAVARKTICHKTLPYKGNSIFTYWYDKHIYNNYDDLQPFKAWTYAYMVLPARLGITRKHRFRRSLMARFEWCGRQLSTNNQTDPWYYEVNNRSGFTADLTYVEQFINKSKEELVLELISTNEVHRNIAELALKMYHK